jgi:hypothetical protein
MTFGAFRRNMVFAGWGSAGLGDRKQVLRQEVVGDCQTVDKTS